MEVSMRTVRQLLVAPLVLMMALPSSGFAQERHAVPPAALSATVAAHAAAERADRAAVREALARPEVANMAASMGLDVDRVAASAETLSGTHLQRAAAAARDVNDSLVGGQSTLVISTTTVIIGLLILLLIIVAVD
jgi:hypothetical protein